MAKFRDELYDCGIRAIFAFGVVLLALCPIYPWYKAYTESEKWLYFWYGFWMLCTGLGFQVFGYGFASFAKQNSSRFSISIVGMMA